MTFKELVGIDFETFDKDIRGKSFYKFFRPDDDPFQAKELCPLPGFSDHGDVQGTTVTIIDHEFDFETVNSAPRDKPQRGYVINSDVYRNQTTIDCRTAISDQWKTIIPEDVDPEGWPLVGANFYIYNDPTANSFRIHGDEDDNFICHIHGETKWELFEDVWRGPRIKEGSKIDEFVMKSGDVLYIPHSRYHRASCNGVPRVLVSFPINEMEGRQSQYYAMGEKSTVYKQ